MTIKKTIRCLSENLPAKTIIYTEQGYKIKRIDKEKVGNQQYVIVQFVKEIE